MGATAVFGVPLYNQASYLEEAVTSLLSQTRRDLAVVLVDDASTDATEMVGRAFAERDARVTYRRNVRRLGMVENWRHTFACARALHPDAPYFAWGSDHDRWEPAWLERLAAVLDEDAEIVLAYPAYGRLDQAGAETPVKSPPSFATREIRGKLRRFSATIVLSKPGIAVYGLYRADALERAGVFRRALSPDRLLLAELAFQGRVAHCPEVLWWRRFRQDVTPARQRSTLFGERAPRWAYAPWYLQHAVILGRRLGVRGEGRPAASRALGLAAAGAVPLLALARAARLEAGAVRRTSRRARKRLRTRLVDLRSAGRSGAH